MAGKSHKKGSGGARKNARAASRTNPSAKMRKPKPAKKIHAVRLTKAPTPVDLLPEIHEKIANDLEGLLIEDLILGVPDYSSKTHLLHASIFNATEEMRSFAYDYGFTIGKEISRISGNGSITHLINFLDNGGIGRMLYTPVGNVVIIKGIQSKPASELTDVNTHTYEAGVISGYLSASTSMHINTIETHCGLSGKGFCQFVSNDEHVLEEPIQRKNAEEAIEGIARIIESSSEVSTGRSRSYVLLSILPLLDGKMLEESSKLMYLSGERLAASAENPQENVTRIASFFDIPNVKVSDSGNSFSVRLGYDRYHSNSGFVELSTKAFIGFLSKFFHSAPTLRSSTKAGAYEIVIRASKSV